MHRNFTQQKLLGIVLWLTALHSAAVGIGLLVLPDAALSLFGFDGDSDMFFRAQGGVFHLVMVLAYIWAAQSNSGRDRMIDFAIFAKFAATVFLLFYYLFFETIWSVLGSAVSDFLMGLVILLLYMPRLRSLPKKKDNAASAAGWDHA